VFRPKEHQQFTLSVITQYEIWRGLRAKDAHKQVHSFNLLCGSSQVLPLTSEVSSRAAELYADLRRRGQLIDDADIPIAATALEHDCGALTHNTAHCRRVSGLHVEDWLE
jgi:tRNA(fMet)-specific endonuclease VapC